jgi:hypothetical protein
VNAACQENLLACHFGHACYKFVSSAAYVKEVKLSTKTVFHVCNRLEAGDIRIISTTMRHMKSALITATIGVSLELTIKIKFFCSHQEAHYWTLSWARLIQSNTCSSSVPSAAHTQSHCERSCKNAPISLTMSVCLSVCLPACLSREPPNGFWLNFILDSFTEKSVTTL